VSMPQQRRPSSKRKPLPVGRQGWATGGLCEVWAFSASTLLSESRTGFRTRIPGFGHDGRGSWCESGKVRERRGVLAGCRRGRSEAPKQQPAEIRIRGPVSSPFRRAGTTPRTVTRGDRPVKRLHCHRAPVYQSGVVSGRTTAGAGGQRARRTPFFIGAGMGMQRPGCIRSAAGPEVVREPTCTTAIG